MPKGRPELSKRRAMLAILTLPLSVSQVPRSQHGSVSQRVGTTEIAITYNRPVARGRTLFGPDGVVKWGEMWHPGADSATTISFSKAVTIEGQPLAAGRYTVWAIPEPPPAAWTFVFSRGVSVWHTNYPGESKDALRVKVTPETGAHMEVLAYYFPIVGPDSTVLRLHWGETVVPIRIKTS
jgi:hypothetical protein